MFNRFLKESIRAILIVIVLLLLVPSKLLAQSFSFPAHEKSEKHTAAQISAHLLPDTIIVRGDSWFDVKSGTSWKVDKKIKSTHDLLRFYVDHSYKVKIKFPYSYSICFKTIAYTDSTTATVFPSDTLTLNYSPDSLATYQDLVLKKYSGYHKLLIVITNMFSNSPGITPMDVDTISALNFVVEGAVLTQRYDKRYGSDTYYGSSGAPALYSLGYMYPAYNYAEVLWNLSGVGITNPVPIEPANFELEWQYLDNYKKDIVTGEITERSKSDINFNFTNNATRVWLDTNYFRIPVVYQKGYIVYRIRMVRPDSNLYQYPIYSDWTTADNGVLDDLSEGINYMQIEDAHKSDSVNWQYTVSFAENGRYKHVLSYFDGLLKNRQSITRFNSTPDRLIATEQVYDYEGRPAISILPTPIPSTAFTYQSGLSTNVNTALPYVASDFDTIHKATCPLEIPLAPLHSSALANIYYSSSNPDQSGFQKFVPDAGGYPFVQTIYSAGYDKRIDRQGGAGDSLQIGFGHDTRNDYVSSDQKDLNSLFGIDVGWSGYYRKTVTTDPNGQVSMSVQDFKGRQVASSMIGRGPDPSRHAIIPNENVPDSSFHMDDLIKGTPQSIIGNRKLLTRDFYMDVTGYDSVQYVFDFEPMMVCAPTDSAFLSVKAHYNYEIIDQCGNTDLFVENDLGTTGVMKTGATVSAAETRRGVFLAQGKHSLSKELTVNVDDIYAAVDSLMKDPPGCFKDEPYFIKKSVLKEQFPCPYQPDDACATKKKQMMDELWPGKKYGKFTPISSDDVDGGNNSIFTRFCTSDTTYVVVDSSYVPQPGDTSSGGGTVRQIKTTCKYRYQICVDLPDGAYGFDDIGYRTLDNLPVNLFMYFFNDSIAESLLPLHPEYCKLKNCYDDNYQEILESFSTAANAEANNRFWLDSIIKYDPILTKLSGAPLYFSHARDSLATYRGGKLGIDTLSLIMSYCNCNDSIMAAECMSRIFKTPISNLSFVDPKVKEIYFKKMLGAYFSNRERFKNYLLAAADSNCGPCDSMRMTLIPPSVFASVYNPDGSYDVSDGSVFSDASSTFKRLLSMDAGSGMPMDTLYAYGDSARLLADSASLLINSAKIDSVISTFANCTPSANLAAVSDTLMALSLRVPIMYGNFQPKDIRYALEVNGISITDLCNPYMVNYDYSEPRFSTLNTGCKPALFYDDTKTFLNKEPIQALVEATASGNSSSYPMTISISNLFEQQLAGKLSSTSIKVQATMNADTSLYVLNVTDNVAFPSDTVKLYFEIHKADGVSCLNILAHSATPTADVFSFDDIRCIREDYATSLGAGYVLNLSFVASIRKDVGSSTTDNCSLLSWNSHIQMTDGAGSLQECVPCTQMLALYKQFDDSMNAFGVKGIDHPLYATMLRNFMNDKLHKVFSWEQYARFIESCALADSLPFTRYNGYASIVLPSDAAVTTFLNYINTTDGVYLDNYLRYKDVDSIHLLLDFNSVPVNKLLAVSNHVASYATTAVVNQQFNPAANSNFMGWILVYDGTPFDSTTLRSDLSSTFDINPGFEFNMWTGRRYVSYIRYDVRSKTGVSNALISSGLAEINRFIAANEVAGYFMNRRESTADDEYSTAEKQAYLQYVYLFSDKKPVYVLDTIQSPYLKANVYPTRSPQYGSSSGIADINNLYLSQTAHPGLTKAIYMLDKAKAHFTGGVITPSYTTFPPDRKIAISGLTLPESMNLYFCGDQTYWYRYFGTGDTMFNIFFRLPLYITDDKRDDYSLNSVFASAGSGASRNLKLSLVNGSDTVEVNAYTDFTVGKSQILHDVLLTNDFGSEQPIADTIENCERTKLNSAVRAGKQDYALYIDSMRLALRGKFYDYVMSHLGEKLYLGYRDQRFNYTLYYYDRAGNLTRTVPPAGVKKVIDDSLDLVDDRRSAALITPGVLPEHTKISVYEYNTLDKVIRQNTPDGGEVNYSYDVLGRIIYSQNKKQAAKEAYTYTFYDDQGRVTETGEVDLLCGSMVYMGSPGHAAIDSFWSPCWYMWYPPSGKGPLATPAYYSTQNPYVFNANYYSKEDREAYLRTKNRSDVVYTIYDTVAKDISVITGVNAQENLRKRVTCIKYFEKLPSTDTFYRNYTYATHFSYDIAGNVKTLLHDFPALETAKQRYKTVDYDYDLASGKVNMLSYNRGWGDQFYQQYNYDDDNRITKVETSADGFIWKRDAEYQYYQHGPLARVSIGDLRVQGIDFAYTIQGWLKAVNGDLLKPAYEMGQDSFGNNVHAYDAAATAINYFKGDYKPIGGIDVAHVAESAHSLYNGNISRLSSDLLPFKPLMASFAYDQLNRIKYASYDSMSPIVAGVSSLYATPNYYSNYSYDPDGNIQSLIRRANKAGSALIMDSMHYYYAKTGSPNKLLQITDSADNNYIDDVDKFTDKSIIRYQYDAIGNVTKDMVSNQDTIQWNLYNKVTNTHNKLAHNRLRFTYDGAGHRVAKYFYQDDDEDKVLSEDNEYFVHDAQGNILAVYKQGRKYVYEDAVIRPWAIADLSSVARTELGVGPYITDVLANDFMRDGSFESGLLPYVAAFGASHPPTPVMVLLNEDKSLLEMLINTKTDWLDTFSYYAFETGNPMFVQSALSSAFVDENYEMANHTSQALMFTSDTIMRKNALAALESTLGDGGTAILRDMHVRLELPFDSLWDGYGLAGNLVQMAPDPAVLSDVLTRSMVEARADNDYMPYFDQIIHPLSPFMMDSFYVHNFPMLIKTAINEYGDRALLSMFFNDWSHSYQRLKTLVGSTNLYMVDYHADPAGYLSNMAASMGPEFIDSVIANMDLMNLDTYHDRIFAAAGVSAADVLSASTTLSTRYTDLIQQQILNSESFSLAEHHLYGSSRLGIKNYLSGQVDGYWMSREGIGSLAIITRDSGSLLQRLPWYSGLLNEPITKTEKVPFGHTDASRYVLAHMLGQKQYEVTNHLGNVLSTISDNRYEHGLPDGNGVYGDSIKVFAPAVPTSYDYYPFGMLMPGRYMAADTTVERIDVLKAAYGPSGPVVSGPVPVGGTSTTSTTGTIGHASFALLPDEGLSIDADTIGAGVELDIAVNPGEYNELQLNTTMLLGDGMRASVYEKVRDEFQVVHVREIASELLTMEGTFLMDFVPSGSTVTLKIVYNDAGYAGTTSASAGAGGAGAGPAGSGGKGFSSVKIASIIDATQPAVSHYYYGKVVKNYKDLYRFGFDGMEKNNNIFGRGTHYDFKLRAYDARTGRFNANDPLKAKFPWWTPYQFAGNTPMGAIDLEGGESLIVVEERVFKLDGSSQLHLRDYKENFHGPLGNGILHVEYYGNNMFTEYTEYDNQGKVAKYFSNSSSYNATEDFKVKAGVAERTIGFLFAPLIMPSQKLMDYGAKNWYVERDSHYGPLGFKYNGWPMWKGIWGTGLVCITGVGYLSTFAEASATENLVGGVELAAVSYSTANDVVGATTGKSLPGNKVATYASAFFGIRGVVKGGFSLYKGVEETKLPTTLLNFLSNATGVGIFAKDKSMEEPESKQSENTSGGTGGNGSAGGPVNIEIGGKVETYGGGH